MPQIIFKGITESTMKMINKPLVHRIAALTGCPERWVSLELCPSHFYDQGGSSLGHPIVQVWWFPQSDDVKKAIVDFITDTLVKAGHSVIQISFHAFEKENYFGPESEPQQ